MRKPEQLNKINITRNTKHIHFMHAILNMSKLRTDLLRGNHVPKYGGLLMFRCQTNFFLTEGR